MQIVDVIRSLRRHWRASLGILLLTAVALGLFLFTRSETRDPDRWRASVQLLVPARGEDGARPEGVPPSLLQGQATVAQDEDTTRQALEAIGLSDADRGQVAFGFGINERGDIITLTATTATRDSSIALADAYAEAYIDARRSTVAAGNEGQRSGARASLESLQARLGEVEDQLAVADPDLLALLREAEDAVDEEGRPTVSLPPDAPLDTVLLVYERQTLASRIEATQRAYAESSTEALVPQSFATVVERPLPSQVTPELPSPLPPIAVALALGIVLAAAAPVLLDRLDRSIRDARTAGTALSAPVLSTIPPATGGNRQTLARPGTKRDAAYRTLAAASIATDGLPRSIVVTSPVGTMQDSVAANFAAALAGLGLRVALVATDARQSWYAEDADANGPTLPSLLALANAGRLNGELRDTLVPTPVPNLRVLPHGDTESEALLDGLPALLEALADADIDVTVIAGPAMLEEASATLLAWSTRTVLWVVESGQVTEQEAREAAARLALAGATPFGVALVDAKL